MLEKKKTRVIAQSEGMSVPRAKELKQRAVDEKMAEIEAVRQEIAGLQRKKTEIQSQGSPAKSDAVSAKQAAIQAKMQPKQLDKAALIAEKRAQIEQEQNALAALHKKKTMLISESNQISTEKAHDYKTKLIEDKKAEIAKVREEM